MVLKGITFSFSKVNFSLLEKKNPSKKSRFFYYFRSHERSELPEHVNNALSFALPIILLMSNGITIHHPLLFNE